MTAEQRKTVRRHSLQLSRNAKAIIESQACEGTLQMSYCYKVASCISLLFCKFGAWWERVICRETSSITVCQILLAKIKCLISIECIKQFICAVFVDFKAAFDKAPGHHTLFRSTKIGIPYTFIQYATSILRKYFTAIHDDVTELETLRQVTKLV